MRDGTPFYHIAPSLVGHAHNMPSPSREAKIECQNKVFQLHYRHFIERGFTDLITQRFPVAKLMVDGEVCDIRVVWNLKSNGYNSTLWAPEFMLDDVGDDRDGDKVASCPSSHLPRLWITVSGLHPIGKHFCQVRTR
jgi:hypothetical protein